MNTTKKIELLNVSCPTPLLKTADAVKELNDGDTLKVVTNDKGFKIDIKTWCVNTGHKLEILEESDDKITAIIKVNNKTSNSANADNKKSNGNSNNIDPLKAVPVKTVDCSGMQCPGPLLETKKALDSIEIGECVKLISTDIGYSKDIVKWCENTKNTVKDITISAKKDKVTVEIIKGLFGTDSSCDINVYADSKDATTMVCFSGDFDKLIATLIIANGAAAMGHKVSIFFTFWGLNALRRPKKVKKLKKKPMEKMFSGMMPRGYNKTKLSQMNFGGMGKKMIKRTMKKKNVLTLDQMFKEAQSAGVEFIACTMSMDLMGIKAEELVPGCTLAGVGAYLGDAANSSVTLFI